MKNNSVFPFLFFLLILFSFTACQKDKDEEPTKTDMLSAHSWQGEKALVQGMDISMLPQLEDEFPVITAMTLTFRKDGTYTSTYNNNGQETSSTGTWEFRENESKLHFDLLTTFGLEETLVIKELTATRLTLSTTINYALPNLPNQVVAIPAEIYFVSK